MSDDQTLRWLSGTAQHRGALWADKIVRSLARRGPPATWPTWARTPRVLALAGAKVADLSSAEADRAQLLEVFLRAAGERYELLRIDEGERRSMLAGRAPR